MPASNIAGTGTLGGLRHARKDSVNNGWRNTSFRGYADYMQTAGVRHRRQRICSTGNPHERMTLMCAEAVPWRCHRSLVADDLTVRGIPVEHIYYDAHGKSRSEPHKLTPFLRVQDQRLWYPAEDDLFAMLPPVQESPEPPPVSASAVASSKSASARSTRKARTGSGRATRAK